MNSQTKYSGRLFTHIISWVIYGFIFFYIRKLTVNTASPAGLLYTILPLISQVTIFYLITTSLYKCLLQKSEYTLFAFSSIIVIIYIATVFKMIYMIFAGINVTAALLFTGELWDTVLLSAVLAMAGTTVRIIRDREKEALRNREIIAESRRLEVFALNNQIDTHFLFNTLNNIYGLARTGSAKTSVSILLLSEILEIILYRAGVKYYPLNNEIKLIENFVKLQEIRMNDTAKISINISGDTERTQIAPMLIFTLVENGFKHFSASNGDSRWMNVEIEASASDIVVMVENSISCLNPVSGNINPKGIGIENLRRRLDLLYPSAYSFSSSKNDSSYKTNMSILSNQ